MSILLKLFLLFTLIPLVELAILLKITQYLGWMQTLLLVILTGAIGAVLAKLQGLLTWQRIQSDLAMGIMPSGRLLDGALIFVAGILLVTPGILTDCVGFALLIPSLRNRIKNRIRLWFENKLIRKDVEIHFDPFQ